MKKEIAVIVFMVICSFALAMGLIACGDIEKTPSKPAHMHEYEWTDNGDGTHSGHCSVSGCDNPDIHNESHVWSSDDKCTKCKAEIPSQGEHSHKWSATWEKSTTHHWHECTASGCTVTDNSKKDGYGAHNTSGIGGVCSVCGYKSSGTEDPPMPSVVEVQSVTIGQTSLSLDKGAIVTLTATVLPNNATDKSVTWQSDKPNIANVDSNGKVAAVATGTAIVTVSTKNGKSATCTITIANASIVNIEGGETDGTQIDMLVDHTTDSVSLGNKVTVSSGMWFLCADIFGQNQIPTKIAAGTNGKLKDGENVFYIILQDNTGEFVNTYTLTIYKSFKVTVNYYDVYSDIIRIESAYTGYEYEINYIPNITGYTFNHWKLNDVHTIKFTPYENTNLYADCTANDYMLTFDVDGGAVSESSKFITFDSAYILPTPEKIGHTFLGWYIGDTKVVNSASQSKYAQNVTLVAKWQVNKYNVAVSSDNAYYGTVSGSGDYDYASSVAITATTKIGCTFIGWYNGKKKLSDELTYAFIMPAEDVVYTAKWCKVTIQNSNSASGTITYLTDTYKIGDRVTVSVEKANLGYAWLGWYEDEKKLTENSSYTFTMPAMNRTYTAKWQLNEDMNIFSFTSTPTTLVVTGIRDKTVSKIIFPDYVTSVREGAFSDCDILTSVTILGSVTSVENNAFDDCNSLETIMVEENNTNYSSKDGILYNNAKTEFIYIPKAIKGTVTIPNSVTSIGSSAFSGRNSLTSINIPNSVTSIGSYAFRGCTGLASITIPNSVTSIGISAFNGCSGLESITLPFVGASKDGTNNMHFGYIFGATSARGTLDYSTNKYINGNADYVSSSLKTVIITDSQLIGNYAFFDCLGLMSIAMPDSVTSVGSYAFGYCDSLTSITIPDGVTSIGSYAFYNCDGLISMIIPKKVRSIGQCAFDNCDLLETIIVEENNTAYSSVDGILYNNDKTELIHVPKAIKGAVTMPSSVTSIGSYAFYGCSGLTSIIIPNSVKNIDEKAFYNCNNLTSITLPFIGSSKDDTNNTYFGYLFGASSYSDNSKYVPSSLKTVVITDGQLIASNAFNGCNSLIDVTIRDGVMSVGSYAFRSCAGLASISIPNSVTSIGSDAFDGCSVLQYNEYDNAYYLGNSNNKYFAVIKAKSMSITSCALHINAAVIVNGAFYNCKSLTNITIPDGVTNIGSGAFNGCASLTDVIIPDSVITIGEGVFRACTSLASITLPFVGESRKTANDTYQYPLGYIFGKTSYTGGKATEQNYCGYSATPALGVNTTYYIPMSLKSVTISGGNILFRAFHNCAGLTNIKLSDDVTSIGTCAFQDCSSITSITISSSVTSIGGGAFSGCSSLESVNWNATACETTEDIGLSSCKRLTSVKFGQDITSIPSFVFQNCTAITNISIPSNVIDIGAFAFYGCASLWILNIAEDSRLKTIGSYAFYDCSRLGIITIPDSVEMIGNYAFYGCNYGGFGVKFGENSQLKSIGDYAFRYSNIKVRILIPKAVTSIGDSAFDFDGINVKVLYQGTAAQWKGISINNKNIKISEGSLYYYSETEPTLNINGTAYEGNYWHYVNGEVVIWTKN